MADKVSTSTTVDTCECCGGAPVDCSCALEIPRVDLYSGGAIYPSITDAETAIAGLVSNCIGYISDRMDGTVTINSFTADNSIPDNLVLTGHTTDNGSAAEVGMYASVSLKAGAILTVDWTSATGGTPDPGDPAVRNLIFWIMSCDGADSIFQEVISDNGNSGTFASTAIPADGTYLLICLNGYDAFPSTELTASFDITSDDTMVVNPVIALWDDSGTTRQLEACPYGLLPLETESSGALYFDEAAAQAALDDYVVDCELYSVTPLAETGYTATIIGSSFYLNLAGLVPETVGALSGWICVNLVGGETVSFSAEYSVTQEPGDPECFACNPDFPDECNEFGLAVLVRDGRTWELVASASDSDSATTGTSLLVSDTFTAPYTGKFYFNAAGNYALNVAAQCAVTDQYLEASITSTGLAVNTIKAL
jgi:hypothetical protein